jgi:Polyketide cyclase / dehydrase and lipid transport
MHLESSIVVKESSEDVIDFFYHPESLTQWDRSVAEMIPKPQANADNAATFDTIAPSGMKMTYEVIEMDPAGRSVKILLAKSKMFKKAIWHFEFDPAPNGTKVTCHIYFTLRFLYYFLYPVLFFNKSALLRDLNFFQTALDNFMKKKLSSVSESQAK